MSDTVGFLLSSTCVLACLGGVANPIVLKHTAVLQNQLRCNTSFLVSEVV